MDTVLRGVAVYLTLLLLTRLSGRRTLSQMTPFDFVLVLVIAETTQQALVAEDRSLTAAALLMATLFGVDIVLSHVKRAAPSVDKWLDGAPTLLVADGKPLEDVLKRARVDMKDVMEAARKIHGLERPDQVKHAVLENTGEISIVPK